MIARVNIGRHALVCAVVLICAFVLFPLLVIIPLSFSSSPYLIFPPPGWSLQWYANFFTDPTWTSSTVQSLEIAVASMVIATSVGAAAAFPLVRREFPGKRVALVFIASPLVVPEIVIAIGLYIVVLPIGVGDTWWAVALGQSVLTVPVATLIVAASLRNFDRSLEDAALSLGANHYRTIRHVTLPVIRPAIVVTMAFTFIFSLNDLLIPLFIASITVVPLPVRIWTDIRSFLDLTTLSISVMWFCLALMMLVALGLQRHRTPGTGQGLTRPGEN